MLEVEEKEADRLRGIHCHIMAFAFALEGIQTEKASEAQRALDGVPLIDFIRANEQVQKDNDEADERLKAGYEVVRRMVLGDDVSVANIYHTLHSGVQMTPDRIKNYLQNVEQELELNGDSALEMHSDGSVTLLSMDRFSRDVIYEADSLDELLSKNYESFEFA